MLDGPQKVNDFEKFFETKHQHTAEHLAAMYGLPYYFCTAQNELGKTLQDFLNDKTGKSSILEIKTDGVVSADVYAQYFEYLRQSRK